MMEVEGREARALASCLHNRAGRGTIARCRHGHLVCEREGAIPTAVSKGDRGLRRQRMLEEDHNSHHRWVLSSKSRPPSHVTRVFWTGGTARRSKVPFERGRDRRGGDGCQGSGFGPGCARRKWNLAPAATAC